MFLKRWGEYLRVVHGVLPEPDPKPVRGRSGLVFLAAGISLVNPIPAVPLGPNRARQLPVFRTYDHEEGTCVDAGLVVVRNLTPVLPRPDRCPAFSPGYISSPCDQVAADLYPDFSKKQCDALFHHNKPTGGSRGVSEVIFMIICALWKSTRYQDEPTQSNVPHGNLARGFAAGS